MKRIWLLFLALMGLVIVVPAQTPEEQAKESTRMVTNIKRLDLLNQILPVLMTKDQIKKILPSIEQARGVMKAAEKKEYDELKKMAPKVETALKEATTKGLIPPPELIGELNRMFAGFRATRQKVEAVSVQWVEDAMTKNLNAGQRKAAANALSPQVLDPTIDPKTMTEEQKLGLWIERVMLDPDMYDILIQLSR